MPDLSNLTEKIIDGFICYLGRVQEVLTPSMTNVQSLSSNSSALTS